MKILYVLDYYFPHLGGVEIVFQRLAERLVTRGHQVKIITTHYTGCLPAEVVNGVEIERVPTPIRGDRYFFTFMNIPAVFRNISRYDLVHTSAYNGALTSFLGARLMHRPIVYTAPEVLGPRWKTVQPNPLAALIMRTFEWLITRLPYDYLVAISDSTLQDAQQCGIKGKNLRIYCGVDAPEPSNGPYRVDLRQRIGASGDDFIYLFFGRPGITKGLRFLLGAAEEIQAAIPNARLVLILSDRPHTQYLAAKSEIERLQRSNVKIHLLPSTSSRSELHDLITAANCIVIPSLTEGFGLAAAEACTLGVPVIATKVGSLPEVVFGKNILIEPRSSQAIKYAVVRAANGDWDETPRKEFSWDRMAQEYEDLYVKLITEG